jgi:hypothetical protein
VACVWGKLPLLEYLAGAWHLSKLAVLAGPWEAPSAKRLFQKRRILIGARDDIPSHRESVGDANRPGKAPSANSAAQA